MYLKLIGILLIVTVIGCSNTMQNDNKINSVPNIDDMQAAVIFQSENNSALLQKHISQLLNGANVLIDPESFTQSNQLTTERNTQDKLGQEGMNGTILGFPEIHTFRLFKYEENCYLHYENKNKLSLIEGLDCQPE